MAVMYPNSIIDYNPTKSEKLFYEKLRDSLNDNYRVFYSIRWYTEKNGIRVNSESDFLILDPTLGYLCIEVKGGKGIQRDGDKWKLILYDNENEEERDLNRSPYLQAEESMRYFKDYYVEQFNNFYKGVYGFAVAFPNFNYKELGPDAPKILTIDFDDLPNLGRRIKEIFHYWRGKHNYLVFTRDQRERFINLINKRVSLSAAAGALIEYRNKQLEVINRVQDNYIHFLRNFNQVYITGGAGTGKTWIAIKKAKAEAREGKKVLLLCSSDFLARFIRKQVLGFGNIKSLTFNDLIKRSIGAGDYDSIKNVEALEGVIDFIENTKQLAKYDAIIIDEGQDFTTEWAYCVKHFLEDQKESTLYVFFDIYQNVFNRDFEDEFDIDLPPFTLVENLRNTSNIYSWAVNETGLGRDVIPNTIEGASPDRYELKNRQSARNKLERILRELVDKEGVNNKNITIVSNEGIQDSILSGDELLGDWEFNYTGDPIMSNEIRYRTIEEFKGLESDVVIYLNHGKESKEKLYVAYTRARFYLYELIIKENK